MHNGTAVAHITKMGGKHSQALANLATAQLEWCFENDLTVSAQHLKGKMNKREDRGSRILTDSSDWKPKPSLLQAVLRTWGPIKIDLLHLG